MASVSDKLRRALASSFKGSRTKLARYDGGTRVGGTLVWDGFDGEMQIDRQVKLRRVIDEALAPDERGKVSFILTVTADELASISADH